MIAEPSSDLWTAIKQKYNAWPPDNEDVANQLGTHLAAFASTASTGHTDLHQTGQSLGGVWRDSAGADMVDKASSVATDWSKIAQTAQTQGTMAQTYGRALSFVKQTISGTVAANEPLYELLSASSILHPLRTRLVNHLAGAFQRLVAEDGPTAGHQGPHNTWTRPTIGFTLGGSLNLGIISVGANAGLIQTADGHMALTFTPHGTWDSAAGISGFLGGGVMVSDGQLVSDQGKKFNQVGVTAGDGVAVNGSYVWGNSDDGRHVHDLNLQAGVGGGIGGYTKSGQAGQSYTYVLPIPLPWTK
ncbi:MAG TPA: hypothetical protein VG247_24310 [Pseudonocardiaceae bacterium]|jgi:hypothetical protein|nr:hypothetical protein [Pseudonocardiaceae bacterium]